MNDETNRLIKELQIRADVTNVCLGRLVDAAEAERGDPDGTLAHTEAIVAHRDRLSARVGELERLLARVPGAMNGYFSAGIEEREGGSARRQEKLMADGEALIREIRDFLATQKDKTNG